MSTLPVFDILLRTRLLSCHLEPIDVWRLTQTCKHYLDSVPQTIIFFRCCSIMTHSKVIFLGQQKCGTTSFHHYMKEVHGYKSIHNTLEVLKYIQDPKLPFDKLNQAQEIPTDGKAYDIQTLITPDAMNRLDHLVSKTDAVSDSPFPYLYKHFDVTHPDAKFVLSVRDPEKWYSSMSRFFGNRHSVVRRFVYGYSSPLGHKKRYIKVFKKHIKRCLRYFKDKPQKLLVIDLDEEDQETISTRIDKFLGLPHKPRSLFPVTNVSSHI